MLADQMIVIDDNQRATDRQQEQEHLDREVEQVVLLPHKEKKNINDNRSDEIEIKHCKFLREQ